MRGIRGGYGWDIRVLGERWENGRVLSSLDFCAGKISNGVNFAALLPFMGQAPIIIASGGDQMYHPDFQSFFEI